MLWSSLTISDKYWHSVNLFYCKAYTEVYLEPGLTFLWFSQRNSTIDARLGSTYASAYIYIQVRPIEIMFILNIFTSKYIFSYKRRMK